MHYEFHELADLFPLLDTATLQELAEDIKLNGQNEPVVLYQGKILDGRNRYLACQIAQIEPIVKEYIGSNPVQFVISANLKRRHLNPSQINALGAEIEPLLAEEARLRMLAGKKADPGTNLYQGRAREQAADVTGGSPSGIATAKSIRQDAPDLFNKIKTGEITTHRAKKELSKRKKEERRKTLVVPQAPISPFLYVGSADNLTMIPSGSIDLIITSPPYNLGADHWPMGGEGRTPRQGIGYEDQLDEEEYQNWQLDCLVELFRVSCEGGSLFYNHKPRTHEGRLIHPLRWLLNPRNPWTLRQEIIWDRGSTHNHNATLFWPEDERIYWLVKGERPTLPDHPIGMSTIWKEYGPVADQSWHPAPFPLALPRMILEAVGRPGITVLDPFAGSCTTLKVALEFGCTAIGVDSNGDYLQRSAEESGWQWTKPGI